jgi:flagellar export protein FliJ
MTPGFRLGVVLRLRELAEDAAQNELAVALRAHLSALDEHRESIRAATVESERACAMQRASREGASVPAGELAEAIASVERAEEAFLASQAKAVAAADVLLESRSRLAEATSRRKVVERLRDRAAATERTRLQHVEDAVLNEVASTRHAWAALEQTQQ